MAFLVAKNGNAAGPNDPDFVHFADEQTGILLPSCPGYPDWLPQLQLTLKGRLCFWNFPAWIYKVDACKISNQGTSQYLRDSKQVTASNPYPPIPADRLGTNGPDNQYFWGACNISYKMTDELYNFLTGQAAFQTYVNNQTNPLSAANKGIPYATILQELQSVPGWWPKPGEDNKQGMLGQGFNCWDWIGINIQYYLNKYLNVPFDINGKVQYGKSWITILMNASNNTDLNGWLGVCNFLLQPQADPSTWDKVAAVLPAAILTVVGGVLTIATAGAATPLLAGTISKVSQAVKSSSAQNAQVAAQTAYDSLAGGFNTSAISLDTSGITNFWSNASDTEKEFIYIGAALVAILIIVLILTRKK